MKRDRFQDLQRQLGLPFRKPQLLRLAFTHTSYVNEHRSSVSEDNERLEFLGDAVLQLLVSEHLFQTHPQRPEGELTRMRAAIVCEPSLARFAELLHFGSFVRLGKGEEQLGGRQRPALLADLFEAFVGALYLDAGVDTVREFLRKEMFPRLEDTPGLSGKDYKSKLQELAQNLSLGAVEYRVAEERGPAHDREFVVEVLVGEQVLGIGSGRTKKEAEQRAAEEAWERTREKE
ncbi:ribonuclease III [Paenibacillus herberti]|uniref:Ribonuclease 3 n=1 Tax=Paenibacillus herberti TaxID=1619309 RepID=A0A229P201_9BACL|nr:ribonuclease III [Paenibacillus herberti]OXM15959.1 ribonuclease III [Paenibacillus herberti]